MDVTSFEDMTDESEMMYQALRSTLRQKAPGNVHSTLEESHLFVQYPREFGSVERLEWG